MIVLSIITDNALHARLVRRTWEVIDCKLVLDLTKNSIAKPVVQDFYQQILRLTAPKSKENQKWIHALSVKAKYLKQKRS